MAAFGTYLSFIAATLLAVCARPAFSLTIRSIDAKEKMLAHEVVGPSSKKGIGIPSSSGYGDDQLTALNVSWFYGWSSAPKVSFTVDVEFIPMIWGCGSAGKDISPSNSSYVLGFNEPDHSGQANCEVERALSKWSQVVAKAPEVVSPGCAGNPVTGSWMPEFMAAEPEIDYLALHWYKGRNSTKFIEDVKDAYEAYQKPIWVTEFALQTVSEAKSNPDKYTQEEVNDFISTVVPWMESTAMVARYAWHDSKYGTSCLYNDDGSLSESGLVYAIA
mmetsp:Transcript_68049/g.127091  ORF Transcript_68049/g.127091 Transcript_68049/m.127091 type:complete len:275 (+) Transcript_68049:56-880(+)